MNRPDFFERAQAEQSHPHYPGASEFEMMVVLGLALEQPWQTKSELALRTLTRLGRSISDNGPVLRCVDGLVSTHLLHRHDFRFEVTPTGRQTFDALRSKNSSAIKMLAYGVY